MSQRSLIQSISPNIIPTRVNCIFTDKSLALFWLKVARLKKKCCGRKKETEQLVFFKWEKKILWTKIDPKFMHYASQQFQKYNV